MYLLCWTTKTNINIYFIKIYKDNPNPTEINKVVDVLKKGGLIIYPTDTVYGLGCLLGSEKGVSKIYEIKKREGKKPLAVLCADIEQVKTLVMDFSQGEDFAKKYWPGALTLVFNKLPIVGDFVTSGFNTIGVRIPNDEIALSILRKFGPMAVTSLNISSDPAILKYEDALKFAAREVKRANKYKGIIMDPPAWGIGASGEKWKLEDKIDELMMTA